MSNRRPPSGPGLPKGASTISLTKDSSFSFTPEQKVSVKEWIENGLSILKLAQQHQSEQGPGSDTHFSSKFQASSASVENLKAENFAQNDDQVEQLSIRVLVRVILCLGE